MSMRVRPGSSCLEVAFAVVLVHKATVLQVVASQIVVALRQVDRL